MPNPPVSPALTDVPILAHVVRNGVVESVHRGSAVVTRADGIHRLGAVLSDEALLRGGLSDEGGDPATGAAHVLRVGADRVGDARLGGACGGRGDPPERVGQSGQGYAVQRRPAPVHRERGDRAAGEPGDGGGDGLLERVFGVEIARQVPAVGGDGREHPGVLARAVLGEGGLAVPGPDPLVAGLLVDGVVRRVAQVALGEPGAVEDLQRGLQVERLARMARAHEGELVGRQVQAGSDHGARLDWLARRPREDQPGRVAPRMLDRAVGAGDDRGAAMDALDDAVAHDVGKDRDIGEGW